MSSITAESIYKDAATLGKTSSYIYFIIAIVVAVILTIYALYINSQPAKPVTRGFIITAACTIYKSGQNNTIVNYSCLLNVKYTVNNIEYINNLVINSDKVYNPNTYIDIEYDEDEEIVLIEDKVVLALVPEDDFEDWDVTLSDGLEDE